jgi:hypothetical protein
MTCEDIKTFWPNFYHGLFGSSAPGNNTLQFLKTNYDWMKVNAVKYAKTDEYWYTVSTILQQVEGLYEGYVAGCGSSTSSDAEDDSNPWATLDSPTLEHFLIINGWGDLYQITHKLLDPGHNAKRRGNLKAVSCEGELRLIERCSAIVKVLSDAQDIVYGHATWDTYESLYPRIIKRYSYQVLALDTKSETSSSTTAVEKFVLTPFEVYFSSSPALLTSVDDFYTVDGYSELGVMETSNSLYNLTILALIKPESMLSWTRIMVSNQIAKSGYNWAEVFARYHSGSYPNQWMVLDLPMFKPNEKLVDGFFTVFEEVPGLVHYEDQTDFLNTYSYWPSFNNPFYDDIFIAAGYDNLCALREEFCHDTAPRALIFEEYHDQVKDVDGGKWILSYNNWKRDAASEHDSCNAIACRGDLELKDAENGPYGALDAKVTTVLTSRKSASQTKPIIYARLGPTTDQQPVFCWSKYANESDYSHVGHPDCFDFEWATFPPA